ncbi:14-3-3 domain-containing protein [Fusarium redolens]|uniref:14-3-3 domain-containing protein n=1 Tax=Fusarium redolens TaxID=48865 RepID=A0A9P9HCF9_FUSRE|nr:14-3-3 domain-containing protein [Fusarium redolens]KAH7255070.1 14-3-3 domain-containing protein [Fusarium redolens]
MQGKNHFFLARLCGQAQRYDDMVPLLKQVVKRGGELSVDERNLLTTAFNKAFDTRRASWRIIFSIEKNQYKGSEKHFATIRGYRIKIENEIEEICRDVLDLLDQSLIPNASTGESMALYYKMKGDYSRYLTEFVSGEKHNRAVISAHNAYKIAAYVAKTEFTAAHPFRLGLAVNFSVFYYRILNSRDRARYLAKRAFDDAKAEIDVLTKEPDDDSILLMQLLCINLALWASSDSGEREGISCRNYMHLCSSPHHVSLRKSGTYHQGSS